MALFQIEIVEIMNKLVLLTVLIAMVPFITPFHLHSDEESDWPEQLYNGQRTFFVNLLNTIQKSENKENQIFSPHSIYHGLLLAYFGSEGETEQSLRNGLHLDWADSKKDVINAYTAIKTMRKDRAAKQDIELRSVDKFFVTDKAALT